MEAEKYKTLPCADCEKPIGVPESYARIRCYKCNIQFGRFVAAEGGEPDVSDARAVAYAHGFEQVRKLSPKTADEIEAAWMEKQKEFIQ